MSPGPLRLQVVAKLTADNLMFLMQLKKAEADLAATKQENTQLKMAVEKQRGPWFDQASMQRAALAPVRLRCCPLGMLVVSST